MDIQREKDLQTVCNRIIESSVESTGDSGSGGQCPYCYKECRWDAASLADINHEYNCIYLIAKDLLTNQIRYDQL